METAKFYNEAHELIFTAQVKNLDDVRALFLGNRYVAVLTRYKRHIYTVSDLYAGRSGELATMASCHRYGIPY